MNEIKDKKNRALLSIPRNSMMEESKKSLEDFKKNVINSEFLEKCRQSSSLLDNNDTIDMLTVEFDQDENGYYAGNIEQIPDIVAGGETLNELRIKLAHQLVEYAIDYYSDFNRYFNSLNRRSHANTLLQILNKNEFENILEMLII